MISVIYLLFPLPLELWYGIYVAAYIKCQVQWILLLSLRLRMLPRICERLNCWLLWPIAVVPLGRIAAGVAMVTNQHSETSWLLIEGMAKAYHIRDPKTYALESGCWHVKRLLSRTRLCKSSRGLISLPLSRVEPSSQVESSIIVLSAVHVWALSLRQLRVFLLVQLRALHCHWDSDL